jgi:hypothetical protein
LRAGAPEPTAPSSTGTRSLCGASALQRRAVARPSTRCASGCQTAHRFVGNVFSALFGHFEPVMRGDRYRAATVEDAVNRVLALGRAAAHRTLPLPGATDPP